MHDVFISYSSKDKTVADSVCAKLEQEKISCWIAPRDILPTAKELEEQLNQEQLRLNTILNKVTEIKDILIIK
jgi:hypothetical protein